MMIKEVLEKNDNLRRLIAWIGKKRRIYNVQKHGIEAVETINAAFKKQGIVSFADFGTLLGLLREKRLLKHDWDIDLGVVLENPNTLAAADSILQGLGYKMIREFTVDGDIKEQSYNKNHIKIDLQLYYNDDNPELMYCYLFYHPTRDTREKNWKCVIKKCPKVTQLKTFEVNNHQVSIPKNAEEVIRYKYGDNWRIPDKSWVYWEGPNTYKVDKTGLLRSIDNGGIEK